MTHLGELLSAYLDGELVPEEHNRVTTHLAICSACQEDLAGLHGARAAVRGLPILEAPAWVGPLTGEEVNDSSSRHPVAWAAAVAAAVLVATTGIATWVSPTPGLDLNYDDIADTHRVRASQDGFPTGARLVQIAPHLPGGAE